MAIYKAKVETQYAVIPNASLQDERLSYEATGLLAMMLSLPDDWEIHKSWLQEQKQKCGRDKLTRMMSELVEAGYVRKKVKQDEAGKLDGIDWLVFPTAQLKNRPTVKPSDGKSDTTKETDLQSKQDHKDPSLSCDKPKRSKYKYSDRDFECARAIFDRVKVINPAAKEPNFKAWANTVRLMREIDGRTHEQIWRVFTWANRDHFWCANILSPDKLRKQFDKLTVKANAENQRATTQRKLSPAEQFREQLKAEYAGDRVSGEPNQGQGLDQFDVSRSLRAPMAESERTPHELDSGYWQDDGISD